MARRPPILRFRDRRAQGPWFNLTSVEWARNVLPPYHGHDYPEIFWITDGQCEHRINDTPQRLDAGDLVLLRPTDFHSLSPVRGRRFSFTNLAIDPGCWRQLLDRYQEQLATFYHDAPAQAWTTRLRDRDLDALMEDTRRLASQPHTRFAIERFLLNTWDRCLTGPTSRSDESGAPSWLAEARLRVQEPEFFRRGVEAFVELCCRSHEHVSRACRKHYGKTPSQLVNEARLAHAAEALRTTTRSVTHIAFDCGFEAPSRFYAIFREAYGTTPLRYRNPR